MPKGCKSCMPVFPSQKAVLIQKKGCLYLFVTTLSFPLLKSRAASKLKDSLFSEIKHLILTGSKVQNINHE